MWFSKHKPEQGWQWFQAFNLPIIQECIALLPSLSKVSFLNKYPENIKNGEKNRKVAIFIGCLANYNYTNIGDS